MSTVPPSARVGPALVGLLVLAALLRLPSLSTGLFADDLVQRWTLEQGSYGETLRPWALFDFGTALAFEQDDSGLAGVPWWTAPDWKARFLRPLASLWIAGEAALAPSGEHHQLFGLLGFLVLLVLVERLGARLGLAPRARLLGVAVLACCEASHLPVAWTANRNSLLEAVFGVAALVLALDLRRGATARVAGATTLALLAVAAKESGLAFLLALPFALNGIARGWRVLPALAGAGYLVTWKTLGYGASSLFYPEPWNDPALVLERAGLLLTRGLPGLVSIGSLDVHVFHPDEPLGRVSLLFGWLVLAAALVLARRSGSPRGTHTGLPLVLLALTLAVQAPAPPSDRLLLVPGIATALILAPIVVHALETRRDLPTRAALALVLFGALPVSAVSLWVRQTALVDAAAETRAVHLALAERTPDRPQLLVLQLPNSLTGLGLGPGVRLAGGAPELRPWPLRFGRGGLRVRGVGPRTLELHSTDGPFLESPTERVFASFDASPHGPGSNGPGTRHALGPLRIEVLDSAGPIVPRDQIENFRTVRLELAEEIDPGSVALLGWSEGALVELPWPAVGEERELARTESVAVLAP